MQVKSWKHFGHPTVLPHPPPAALSQHSQWGLAPFLRPHVWRQAHDWRSSHAPSSRVAAARRACLPHPRARAAGKTAEVTFTAPQQIGEYTFLCSFPGHFAVGMRGTLVVSPRDMPRLP